MSNLKDTKRRIGSVKSTQKITRAMKLVAAAKYARANQAALMARPYGEAFDGMVKRLASGQDSPLLMERVEKKTLVVILATDRGLCGGLNTNLFKATTKFLDEKKSAGATVELALWGRRAGMYGDKRSEKTVQKLEKVLEKPSYELAAKSAAEFSKDFLADKYDRVYLVYPKFVNALSQEPTVDRLLPVGIGENTEESTRDFILEPSLEALLASLLSKQLASKIFRMFLDGAASEHAARMAAMDSATNNAEEVIRRLTLQYNRARQAAITTELIEITSGAEAL